MRILALALALALCAPLAFADVKETRTGVAFAEKRGELTLTGVALRTKSFLKVKVYAMGLYVADSALPALAGRPDAAHEIQWGDYPKVVVLKFVRDLAADQVQEAFRDALRKADQARVEQFVKEFGAVKSGDEWEIRWIPPGTLELTLAGTAKKPVVDKMFAGAVFGIWIGEEPIQDDIKRDLVSRLPPVAR